MFSHINIGISDFERAFNFYAPLMEILGHELAFREEKHLWAGWKSCDNAKPLFIIGAPVNDRAQSAGNGQMVAFLADCRETVRLSYDKALANGGQCEGAPGLRPAYHENYYGAYFRDIDKNKICICCHNKE